MSWFSAGSSISEGVADALVHLVDPYRILPPCEIGEVVVPVEVAESELAGVKNTETDPDSTSSREPKMSTSQPNLSHSGHFSSPGHDRADSSATGVVLPQTRKNLDRLHQVKLSSVVQIESSPTKFHQLPPAGVMVTSDNTVLCSYPQRRYGMSQYVYTPGTSAGYLAVAKHLVG